MSLTLKQKREVGKIRLDWRFLVNARGHPLGVFPKKRLPYLEEVRAMVLEKLVGMGYQVKNIRPQDANCVIRVYNNLECTIGDEKCCLLGAICYTKAHGANKWVWYDDQGLEHTLDYESCKIEETFKGENVTVEAEFFDSYVKVF